MRLLLAGLLLLLLTGWASLNANWDGVDPDSVAAAVVALVDTGEPVYLDLQAGDLTSALDLRIRKLLIAKGADLREESIVPYEDSPVPAEDSLGLKPGLTLAQQPSRLVRVTLELGWKTLERKSFFGYRSERLSQYEFTVRQIALPQGKLESIDQLSFTGAYNGTKGPDPAANLKWFEPVLAVTALASIVYLLWTTE